MFIRVHPWLKFDLHSDPDLPWSHGALCDEKDRDELMNSDPKLKTVLFSTLSNSTDGLSTHTPEPNLTRHVQIEHEQSWPTTGIARQVST